MHQIIILWILFDWLPWLFWIKLRLALTFAGLITNLSVIVSIGATCIESIDKQTKLWHHFYFKPGGEFSAGEYRVQLPVLYTSKKFGSSVWKTNQGTSHQGKASLKFLKLRSPFKIIRTKNTLRTFSTFKTKMASESRAARWLPSKSDSFWGQKEVIYCS